MNNNIFTYIKNIQGIEYNFTFKKINKKWGTMNHVVNVVNQIVISLYIYN